MKEKVKKKPGEGQAEIPAGMSEKDNELGVIKIHANVISSLVRKIASEIEGITRLAGSTLVDSIAEYIGNRRISDRAITICIDEDKVAIEIKVNIEFGYKVPEVAEALQTAVVEQVEATTGMTVTNVSVVVQEIEEPPALPAPEKEVKEEE
tara:strand:+ start:1712 stop:2164 length:453 start_codon:yes stop_codon:yes gene_type:complete